MMAKLQNRRPLASRQTGWAIRFSRWLAETRITPNQISVFGMVAALIAAGCFWIANDASATARAILFIIAALSVQMRLLCNLFDGMVAVEAGRASPDGGFWNEFPDRISDMLIFLGVAICTGSPALGWTATAFAFLTAYIRELGINTGAGADFVGPMAKQQRMAAITIAAIISTMEPLWGGTGQVLRVALYIIIIGAAFTALRRAYRIVRKLQQMGMGEAS